VANAEGETPLVQNGTTRIRSDKHSSLSFVAAFEAKSTSTFPPDLDDDVLAVHHSPSFHWPVELWSCTVTANCPVYGLNPVPAPPAVDDMLLPSLSREHGDLGNDSDSWLFRGIVYNASARSAARFRITSCARDDVLMFLRRSIDGTKTAAH